MKKDIFIIALLFFGCNLFFAQENVNYQKPPKEILELADYERAPSVSMDDKKDFMLLSYRNTYKSLDELNQEEMRLGGLRINPTTNISSTTTFVNNLKIGKVKTGAVQQVEGLPENPKITNISWSPNQSMIAFTNTTTNGNELWIIDVANAIARKLTSDNLNANLGNPISWFKDNKRLLIKVLPTKREALINNEKALPNGPIISEAEGKVSQNRTYQDLLKNKIDEQNFESLVTSELNIVDLNGNIKAFLPKAMYISERFSPDGNYIMVTTIEKPFSYIVPMSRFPQKTTIYDDNGTQIKIVNEVPLDEIRAKGFMSTRKGKRSMNWRSDEPSTLYFVEALDNGDQAIEVPFRDEIFTWKAPFNSNPSSLFKTKQRYAGIMWGNNKNAIVMD